MDENKLLNLLNDDDDEMQNLSHTIDTDVGSSRENLATEEISPKGILQKIKEMQQEKEEQDMSETGKIGLIQLAEQVEIISKRLDLLEKEQQTIFAEIKGFNAFTEKYPPKNEITLKDLRKKISKLALIVRDHVQENVSRSMRGKIKEKLNTKWSLFKELFAPPAKAEEKK